ncbi:MAG: DUF3552 domain-containing protein, partial [Bacteroidetes bacterium]|nr:DUF3552 domain-containing protein [Bacteroidota bacterium]
MDVIIYGVLGLLAGGGVTLVAQRSLLTTKSQKLIKDAEQEAERIKKEKMLQAKENFLKLKEEHEVVMKDRERKLQSNEDRTRSKEKNLDQKMEEIGRKEGELKKIQSDFDSKYQGLELRLQEIDKIHQKRVA